MPVGDFGALPDDARCWVFAADRPLTGAAADAMLALTDGWLAQWTAHGRPLISARDWRDDRFLAVAVDERGAGASGCSVDALFRTLKGAEPSLGVTFASGATLFWRDADGAVQSGSRVAFVEAVAAGQLHGDTPVFDPTITTVQGWRTTFEQPLHQSWHARLVATTRAM